MLKKAALLVQKNWRRLQTSREYRKMRRGFIRLQAAFRGRKVWKWYIKTHRRIVGFQVRGEPYCQMVNHQSLIQRRCKGWVVRYNYHRRLNNIIKLQSLFRMILAKNIATKKRIEVMNSYIVATVTLYTCCILNTLCIVSQKKRREEAERIRREEEERLKKEMEEEEARKQAEIRHRV